jgi:hypothetical protein
MLDKLRRDGIVLAEPFTAVEIREIRDHLLGCPVYLDAHVQHHHGDAAGMSSCKEVFAAAKHTAFCHNARDVERAPHFLAKALGFSLLVQEYFGHPFILYSINAFWTQPVAGTRYKHTHDWHNDFDDVKQLVMLVFGTDVLTEENGAHQYQLGTHGKLDFGNPDAQIDYGYDIRSPAESIVETIRGPAGTVFIEDPTGVHRGLAPKTGPRLLLWARWGISAKLADLWKER